ncbi:MAG: HNH endonuclease [Proteocatella sp.]
MAKRIWTREETILAFDLYCKTPFGKINKTNKDIIELSRIIERTPSSVSMKMCNLASHDPELKKRGVKGLAHGCKMESVIWNEFYNDWELLSMESRIIISDYKKENFEKHFILEYEDIPLGKYREQIIKQRVGQDFFRKAVLSAYGNHCCMTGIAKQELLIASHIKPWNICDEKRERTNPENGLCLNPLHDKAFDRGFITIDKEYHVRVSSIIENEKCDLATKKWILDIKDKSIELPRRFLPNKDFIEYHNDMIFKP